MTVYANLYAQSPPTGPQEHTDEVHFRHARTNQRRTRGPSTPSTHSPLRPRRRQPTDGPRERERERERERGRERACPSFLAQSSTILIVHIRVPSSIYTHTYIDVRTRSQYSTPVLPYPHQTVTPTRPDIDVAYPFGPSK